MTKYVRWSYMDRDYFRKDENTHPEDMKIVCAFET